MCDDICDCGLCEVETCDYCAEPSWRMDDENESWCRRCWARAHEEPPADYLEAVGWGDSASSETDRLYRMKGERW